MFFIHVAFSVPIWLAKIRDSSRNLRPLTIKLTILKNDQYARIQNQFVELLMFSSRRTGRRICNILANDPDVNIS